MLPVAFSLSFVKDRNVMLWQEGLRPRLWIPNPQVQILALPLCDFKQAVQFLNTSAFLLVKKNCLEQQPYTSIEIITLSSPFPLSLSFSLAPLFLPPTSPSDFQCVCMGLCHLQHG